MLGLGLGLSLVASRSRGGAPVTPALSALSLSSTSYTVGTPSSGTIIGAYPGSSIALSNGPTGFTINSVARTWAYDGTGSATTGSLTLTETLVGATGSPRATVIGWTVAAVADTTAPTITSTNPSGSYAEMVAIGGTLTANETAAFGKTGTDAGLVTLNTSTGVWSIPTTDYETKTSYSWTFTATDGSGNIGSQAVSLTITDVAEGGGPTFPTTTDNTLPVPTLTLVSGQTTYPPQFDIGNLADAIVGDTLWIEQRDKAGALVTRYSNTIDDAEATAEAASFGLSAITTGTFRYSVFLARTSVVSVGSVVVIHGPDDVEPTLSLPTATLITDNSATIGAFTDEANGTLYYVLTTANSAPSAVQVEAGQTSTGAAATKASNQAITTTGAKTFGVTGLTPLTTYYRWFMHKDAAGNRSAVLAGGSFATTAVLSFSALEATPDIPGYTALSNNNRTSTTTQNVGWVTYFLDKAVTSGKVCWEYTGNRIAGSNIGVGVAKPDKSALWRWVSNGGADEGAPAITSLAFEGSGDKVLICADLTNPADIRVHFRLNGTWLGSGAPGTAGVALPTAWSGIRPTVGTSGAVGASITINPGNVAVSPDIPAGYTMIG